MRKDIKDYIETMKVKGNKNIILVEVARQFDCDYRTVRKYYNERDQAVKKTRKPRVIKKKLDGFEGIINAKVNEKAPAIAIYKLLADGYGYTGKYSTVKAYVHKFKKDKQEEVTVHFETNPGEQCQIDWKENLVLTSKYGEVFTVNIFLSILGYSRLKYIELTLDKNQMTLFKCLTNMFEFLGGVPRKLLFDNMRTVVDQSRTQYGKAIYNDRFYQFSKDAGFIPESCMAYRPNTKGKVETVAKIMNRLKVYNNEFIDYDDLNRIVMKMNEDINKELHSTTKEVPIKRFEKEKEYLNPLPRLDILKSYYSEKVLTRKVPKDCLISYEGLKYSVQPAFTGKVVSLERKDDNLYIYYNQTIVSKHKITGKPINYTENDYKLLLKHSLIHEENIERICEDNLKIFDKL